MMDAPGDKQYLFVSDLDGTLLDANGRLSERARAGIERIKAAGVPFTAASARSVQGMQGALGGLSLDLPVIAFNGAFLSDLSTARHELIQAIDGGTAELVCDAAAPVGVPAFVSSHDGSVDLLFCPEPINAGMASYIADRVARRDPRLRKAEHPRRWRAHSVVCITYIDRPERLAEVGRALAFLDSRLAIRQFEDLYCPGWDWLTVHSALATKDVGLRELVRRRGLSGRFIVVFGDQTNDLPLFRAAHRSVAVANAASEVKSAADEVIGSNLDDSVVSYMLRAVGLE